jgi:hypothetical protein
MAGLKLSGGLSGGLGGVQSTQAPQYGSSNSYGSGLGATGAAFAGPSTTPTFGGAQMTSPTNGFGLAFWIGTGAVVALVMVRRSLPN